MRGPGDGGIILELAGQAQGQNVGFRTSRLQLGGLAIKLERLLLRTETREIRGREERARHVGRREIDPRQQGPLDFCLRAPGQLHDDGQYVIHPRLDLAADERAFDNGDGLLVFFFVRQSQRQVGDRRTRQLMLVEIVPPVLLRRLGRALGRQGNFDVDPRRHRSGKSRLPFVGCATFARGSLVFPVSGI